MTAIFIMEQAIFKTDYILDNDTVLYAGEIVHGIEANDYYRITTNRGEFICPYCDVEMKCANQHVDPQMEGGWKKRPYFRIKYNKKPHIDDCPYSLSQMLSKKMNKYKVKPNKRYYSKLIAPKFDRKSSAKKTTIDVTGGNCERKKYVSELTEQATTSVINHLCETFILTREKYRDSINQMIDYKKVNKTLDGYDLFLPYSGNVRYRYAFWSVQSKIWPRSPRIMYGQIRQCIKCADGVLLAYHVPFTDKGEDWKPVIVKISYDNVRSFEDNDYQLFFTWQYLTDHPVCFVFGKLEDYESFFLIEVEHFRWLSLRSKSSNKSKRGSKIIFYARDKNCEKLITELSTDLWGIYHGNVSARRVIPKDEEKATEKFEDAESNTLSHESDEQVLGEQSAQNIPQPVLKILSEHTNTESTKKNSVRLNQPVQQSVASSTAQNSGKKRKSFFRRVLNVLFNR